MKQALLILPSANKKEQAGLPHNVSSLHLRGIRNLQGYLLPIF